MPNTGCKCEKTPCVTLRRVHNLLILSRMDYLLQLFGDDWTSLLIPSTLLLIHFVAFLSAFHSLQHVRTSQAAVAWVVGLVTLPYLTLPLYWVFARHRFQGYREAIREVEQQHEHAVAAIKRELFTETDARSTSLRSALEQIAETMDTPICSGNAFRLLIDGNDFFDAVLDLIGSAKRYVYAEFYIIRDDEIGNRFLEALIDRAREGITVRLLYDEIGSLRLSASYLKRLTDAGVEVHAFNTRQGLAHRFQINFRNHRKLVVVDGQHSIIGGLNVGDEYIGKATWTSSWRDTGVEVAGSASRKIQAVFAGDYFWATRKGLPEAEWDQCEPSDHAKGLAAICATGPSDIRPRAAMMFSAAIGAATKRLWISSPYLIPDDALLVSLAMAKTRGVDLRILIPAQADHWGAYLASYYYEREFAEIGVPVYRFKGGVLHQKCLLIDDDVVLIGSANLDNRSLHLNFELMVAIEDDTFVENVNVMLTKDFESAFLSNLSETPTRWWFARMGTAIARLFSPVL